MPDDVGRDARDPTIDLTGDLTGDERAAIRGFLQRCEVRLSTMHRVASALLSGAGLMVLLPAVERDVVIGVLRSLVSGHVDASRWLLIGGVAVMLSLPFMALWMVLRDLIHFYFHSNHVQTANGDVFTPRFTLTALRLPAGELGDRTAAALDAARHSPRSIELLVPANDRSRAAIDDRVRAYGGLGTNGPLDDAQRAEALFVLAASAPRSLLDEVAKVEHGMARHVLRTQTIVLRYVKALLVLLTTAMATFAAAAVVNGKSTLRSGDLIGLAMILLAWAPAAVIAVTAPVRWLDRLLRSEGAVHTAVTDDRELTRVELLAIRMAIVGFVAALTTIVIEVSKGDGPVPTRRFASICAVVAVIMMAGVLRSWSGHHTFRRIAGRVAHPRE